MKLNWITQLFKAKPVPEEPPAPPARAQEIAPGAYMLPEGAITGKRLLIDAVPPAQGGAWGIPLMPFPQTDDDQRGEYPQYGWVRGLLDAPNEDDCYIVAFLDERCFKVFGYIDRFGRAFYATGVVTRPPAEYPAVAFARYYDQPEEGQELGAVELYDRGGQVTYPAEYVCREGRYTLTGSWFDFSVTGQELCLDDALARAFLAFVYRPKLYGLSVPHRELSIVDKVLSKGRFALKSMMLVTTAMEAAELDPAQVPPSLGRCLAYWLREAGITEAQACVPEGTSAGINLVYETKMSRQFQLAQDADSPVPSRLVWKMEGALNRYRLIYEMLGDRACQADLKECNQAVQKLFVDIVDQAADVDRAYDAKWDHPALEWDVRTGIARGMETLRLPLRFEVEYRCDYREGVVSFNVMVPDADMMPAVVWRDDIAGVTLLRRIRLADTPGVESAVDPSSGWVRYSPEERQDAARDYAMRIGLLLAAAAFRQSVTISEVRLQARYFSEDPAMQPGDVVYKTSFSRTIFQGGNAWMEVAKTNPSSLFTRKDPWDAEAVFGSPSLGGLVEEDFDVRFEQVAQAIRDMDARDFDQVEFRKSSQAALGAGDKAGMEINYHEDFAIVGEKLAHCLVGRAESECFAALRRVQDLSNDPQVFAACNDVMAHIAEGSLDLANENSLVDAFLGPDRYVDAVDKANRLRVNAVVASQQGPDGAPVSLSQVNRESMAILRQVVEETQQAGVFQDNDHTVYRVFDSTTSRVLYNTLRAGSFRIPGIDLSEDRGKRVALASDGYFYTCLELLKLMEQDFDCHEEALRYGKLCLKMAPTMAAGYRQLARAYMLIGDMASAREILITALQWVVVPADISLMYYQLAYVEWKNNHPQVAMACYLKAIAESPEVRDQATSELRELVGEERLGLMAAEDVTPMLQDAGIPLAPSEDVLALMRRAARAAVNEGMVREAKNLLSIQLQHHYDDVLAHVLQSLG